MSPSLQPSLARKVAQISCAITWCLLAAGPVFGFAALKPILIREGVYAEKCHANSTASWVTSMGASPLVSAFVAHTNVEARQLPCAAQDLSLNFMFTLAAVVTNVAALPVGSVLDRYGPRVSGVVGALLIFAAALVLRLGAALARQPFLARWFDPYSVGYAMLALGGPFVFISSFQLANSFPRNSGLVLALLTGAFDSSSALFLFYRVVYTTMHRVLLSQFFTVYLAVPVFIFACQMLIMPRHLYKTVGALAKIGEIAIDDDGRPLNPDRVADADNVTESTQLLMRRASVTRRALTILRTSIKSAYEADAEDKMVASLGGVFGIMHGFLVSQQLQLAWFVLMALFTTIQMLRINFFVATVKLQALYLYGDEAVAVRINQFFDLALPLGGLVLIPFIGVVLDNCTTLTTLAVLLTVSLAIGVLGLLAYLPATYFGIVLLVMYRPFYYTAVLAFCAKVFGFDTFGTVYGAIICILGVANGLQQVMDRVTHETFDMNPTPVNALLTATTAVFGAALVGFVRLQERLLKRKRLEQEAQEASVRSVPHNER